ncbi:MAG: M15 family metallopeptidase [Gammaproteobacteria bacterium]|nr:M15 family metallopeptidase [Gammaproteobacteria bacterium]
MNIVNKSLDLKTRECLHLLGADTTMLDDRELPQYEDATRLVVADRSTSHRPHRLTPAAALGWQKLKASAANQGISLMIISAFRSFERQWEIVRRKVESGTLPDEVFRKLAPPGCSQHHTGRAIDIGTYDCEPASEEFDKTMAFAWLEQNADSFGFTMSYPKNNAHGYIYEPWHWFYTAIDA